MEVHRRRPHLYKARGHQRSANQGQRDERHEEDAAHACLGSELPLLTAHDDRVVTREGQGGPRADDDGPEWAVVSAEARADVGDDFARVERGEQRARVHWRGV